MHGPGGRPTWVNVDLAALRWNARQVRRLVGDQVRILAVVKANAYGHGAVACSRALVRAGVDELGVATVEEGQELRTAGLKLPIVIFGLAQSGEMRAVTRLRLQPAVVSREQVRALSQAARRAGVTVPVHLKVDTGMGRIGIQPPEARAFLAWLKKQPRISLGGIFTHFSHADGRDQKLLKQQTRYLRQVATEARALGWKGFAMHASNSAAIMASPETHADMVRPGLMLYGLYPSPRLESRVRLKPALQWTTRIIQLKNVPAGTGLSYGHTFITKRVSRIATLPVGYADGFFRALSNRGRVLVRGRVCPIVGRVCMDMCLVDVSAVLGVKTGDEAVLIGSQRGRRLTADDLAASLDTISYEIVSAIGVRVPRVFQGGRA